MTMQPVIIGDATSQTADIAPSDFAIGWKTAGQPDVAVALDTYQDLFETRLRPILTAIIQADAPTGLLLQDLRLDGPITVRLDFMVGGHAASLSLDLSALFPTTGLPANIAPAADLGSDDAFPHADHGHRLPSRAQGEAPVVGLDQMSNAPGGGFGMRLGFDSVTGAPEFVPEVAGANLSSANPAPVGQPSAPAPGVDPEGAHVDHGHEIAARAIGLMQMALAPNLAAYGRYLGFDPVTGEPAILDAGGGTFLSQSDTPAAYGTPGQAAVVDAAGMALAFAGPYQPLLAPAPPTNLRATDAFDMALETRWNASPDAVTYQWQRKLTTAAWPATAGTSTSATTQRATALPFGTYDFRVRSVGHGGVLQSAWVELTDIPLIASPVPAASTVLLLSRLRSQHLRFAWSNLDVDNGGAGSARVVKTATYDYQYRVVGAVWGALVAHDAVSNAEVGGLTNGLFYEMRVMGSVLRSDGTGTTVDGPWSGPSNQEKPVKTTVTLTYGVAPSRTGAIPAPRVLELRPGTGSTIEITNPMNPSALGEFYALDIGRGDEYARDYVITALETRPLPSDISMGADYLAEAEPAMGPRRYSVGPTVVVNSIQLWFIEVS